MMRMAKVVRQIRLDPLVEEKVQRVADIEGRSFSNATNWLLAKAADDYLALHPEPSQESS